jgi:hypothetical protein
MCSSLRKQFLFVLSADHAMPIWLEQRTLLLVMAVGAAIAAIAVVVLQPTRPAVWMAGVLFGFGTLASVASLLLASRRKTNTFRARSELTDEQIYHSYFSDTGLQPSVVLKLWREAAHTFNVPPGKLRPSDRFGKELGGFWITSEELDALADIATRHAQKFSATVDLQSIITLGDYVRKVAQIEQQSSSSG